MYINNILVLGILLILIVILIYYIRKYRKKKRETKKIIEDKLRDDALNRAIANQVYEELGCELEPPNIPYEVDYGNSKVQLDTGNRKDNKSMLMIVEHSELSQRKFIIELKNKVYIGCHKDNNIMIKSAPIADLECTIFRNNRQIYIKSEASTEVILIRKNQHIYIQEDGVKIKSGDMITIKGIVLELTIVE